MILREVTGNKEASITMMDVPLPAEQLVIDPFAQVMQGVMPLAMLLIFILPVYNTVFFIVKEKESKAKESMRMMGMGDTAYWISWYVFYSTITIMIVTIAVGVLSINVITNTSLIYVWLYFFLFGNAIFGQILTL